MISHRIAFVNHATHVVVMDRQGKVVEEGERSALLADPTNLLAQLKSAALEEIGLPSRAVT